MKIKFLHEPELQFGISRHIDIRFGLMNYGPLDINLSTRPTEIRVGIVGTKTCIDELKNWLITCEKEISAKTSKKQYLFPRFPGFNKDVAYQSKIIFSPKLERVILQSSIEKVCKSSANDKVSQCVELYLEELNYLSENVSVDVYLCAIPLDILNIEKSPVPENGKEEDDDVRKDEDDENVDFHHLLKSKAMHLKKPIQLIIPTTYDPKQKRKITNSSLKERTVQDDATRAWNFFTALYYKANGIPWRIHRESTDLSTCYIGISFYRSLDGKNVQTSVAQVFNELGNGIILRGEAARVTKEDRVPHLTSEGASTLVKDALARYRKEHKTLPARVVLHKSSFFNDAEIEGFRSGLESEKVEIFDFVSIKRSHTKLFRNGSYPPLRGTFLSLSPKDHLLYTRGSNYFFETYPGMYVPRPLEFSSSLSEQSPEFLANEILALSKMNWNNTQFDGQLPITLTASKYVGSILKYLKEGEVAESRYSFYM